MVRGLLKDLLPFLDLAFCNVKYFSDACVIRDTVLKSLSIFQTVFPIALRVPHIFPEVSRVRAAMCSHRDTRHRAASRLSLGGLLSVRACGLLGVLDDI